MKTMKQIFKRYVFLILLITFSCKEKPTTNQVPNYIYEGIEFEMPKVIEPVFPDYSVSIVDYGAVSDGQTLNTQAFSDAINVVTQKGGGRIVIPRGIWLTGPIVLKSNINIHTEAESGLFCMDVNGVTNKRNKK